MNFLTILVKGDSGYNQELLFAWNRLSYSPRLVKLFCVFNVQSDGLNARNELIILELIVVDADHLLLFKFLKLSPILLISSCLLLTCVMDWKFVNFNLVLKVISHVFVIRAETSRNNLSLWSCLSWYLIVGGHHKILAFVNAECLYSFILK